MHAVLLIFTGLLVAHVVWLVAYVAGSIVVRPLSEGDCDNALARIVMSSCCGLAIFGFEGFILGLLGFLTTGGLILAAIFNLAILWIVNRDSVLSMEFWTRRRQELSRAASIPALVVYFVFLCLCTQAAIPDTAGDAINYHLWYAYEWFQAGKITVDPFVKLPYYANNWLLNYDWLFTAGAGRYISFVNWLAGTMEGLAVVAIVGLLQSNLIHQPTRVQRLVCTLIKVLSPLSLVTSATFLRWMDTGMIDTAIGLYFCAVTLSVVYWILYRGRSSAASIAICAAFLIGSKESFFVLIPVFAVLALGLFYLGKIRFRVGLVAIAASCILALPWYVRNTLMTGDPIPPVLNLATRGYDPIYTPKDWYSGLQDLSTNKSFGAAVQFPSRLFFHTLSHDFREYGTSASVLGLYVVSLVVVYLLALRRKERGELAVLSVCILALVGAAYVFVTSSLARYALLFCGTLAAANGSILVWLIRRRSSAILAFAAVVACLALLPSSTAWQFFRSYYLSNYRDISLLPSDDEYLKRLPSYSEITPLLRNPALANGRQVLLVGTGMGYYYQLHGLHPIGGWTGPGRIDRLIAAVDNGIVGQYLAQYNIGAVVVNTKFLITGEEQRYFTAQLQALGFYLMPQSTANFEVFVRSRSRTLAVNR